MEDNKKDLKNIGERLDNLVQTAIDNSNFDQLNEKIQDAMHSVGYGIKNVASQAGNAFMQTEAVKKAERKKRELVLYKNVTSAKVCATFGMVFGYLIGGGCGIGLFVLVMIGFILGLTAGTSLSISILTPLTIIGLGFGITGGKKLSKIRRFELYKKALGGKTYGNITDFMLLVHKSEKFIQKDIAKMIGDGWFMEGHFDQKQTCLITSNETYEEYLELTEKQRKQEEEDRKRAQREEQMPEEVKIVIREGRSYLKTIQACNANIPEYEISNKIGKMQDIIYEILACVEQKPQKVRDLRKMMEYYLPMTVKLLQAYEELCKQPVQGENILNSKKEIENTLDTLNIAFQNLLDDLFQEEAIDVSSDISVLKTMLAQDGLMDRDF